MSLRVFLLVIAFATAAAAADAAEVSVGESWTFEGRNGYSFDKEPATAYRVEITGISDAGIVTRVTNLVDGTVGIEKFTRRWNPVSAERVAEQPFAFSLGYRHFLDGSLSGVKWHREMLSGQMVSNSPVTQHFEFSPAYPEFPDSLEPGVRWNGNTISLNKTTGRHVKMDISGKVVGHAHVTVPAGDFDTVKLERITYVADEGFRHGPTQITEIEWFAPALGRSVKYETRWEYYDQNSSYYPVLEPGDWNIYELTTYKSK
jgi:hypothetical protein